MSGACRTSRIPQRARRLRPLARRLLSTARPPRVAMRARNPHLRLLFTFDGWYVLFIFSSPFPRLRQPLCASGSQLNSSCMAFQKNGTLKLLLKRSFSSGAVKAFHKIGEFPKGFEALPSFGEIPGRRNPARNGHAAQACGEGRFHPSRGVLHYQSLFGLDA